MVVVKVGCMCRPLMSRGCSNSSALTHVADKTVKTLVAFEYRTRLMVSQDSLHHQEIKKTAKHFFPNFMAEFYFFKHEYKNNTILPFVFTDN